MLERDGCLITSVRSTLQSSMTPDLILEEEEEEEQITFNIIFIFLINFLSYQILGYVNESKTSKLLYSSV